MSRPTLEQIEEQALALLDLIHYRHPDDEHDEPRLVTHVIRDLVEVLRAEGDLPVALSEGRGDESRVMPYAQIGYDSVTKIETFEPGELLEVFGMKDDEGSELTPAGLAFEGLQPVAVMYP